MEFHIAGRKKSYQREEGEGMAVTSQWGEEAATQKNNACHILATTSTSQTQGSCRNVRSSQVPFPWKVPGDGTQQRKAEAKTRIDGIQEIVDPRIQPRWSRRHRGTAA